MKYKLLKRFNRQFVEFYNNTPYQTNLMQIIKYNLENDIQGTKPLDADILNYIGKIIIEEDGTLMEDIISDFLRNYQIYNENMKLS